MMLLLFMRFDSLSQICLLIFLKFNRCAQYAYCCLISLVMDNIFLKYLIHFNACWSGHRVLNLDMSTYQVISKGERFIFVHLY